MPDSCQIIIIRMRIGACNLMLCPNRGLRYLKFMTTELAEFRRLAYRAVADPVTARVLDSEGPEWVVIGAQKAATTEFWNRITDFMPFTRAARRGAQWALKELHFWDGCFGVGMPNSNEALAFATTVRVLDVV